MGTKAQRLRRQRLRRGAGPFLRAIKEEMRGIALFSRFSPDSPPTHLVNPPRDADHIAQCDECRVSKLGAVPRVRYEGGKVYVRLDNKYWE